MNDTIFDTISIDRKDIKWEDTIYDLSPVEKIGDLYFKREDKYAPLGYGGINGSKLRQCIWLVNEYVNNDKRPIGILSGTSVKSPQLPMGSAVATHFKLDSIHVIGATKYNIAIKHENVAMASWFGASFHIVPNIAYNPVLQRRVKLVKEKVLPNYFYLEYGITVDHKTNSVERVEAFHKLGSEQVKNIPDHIETLIIPSGSCNSCTSILYGIARFQPKNLKNVYLIGIGPNKIDFIEERLDIIENVSGVYTKPFKRNYVHSKDKENLYSSNKLSNFYDNNDIVNRVNNGNFIHSNTIPPFNLIHHDLHSTKYVDYQDEIPFNYHGLELHPTYEGKVMKYIHEKLPQLINDRTMFWVVGSKPRKEIMYDALKDKLGEFPTKIKEYNYVP